MILRKYDLSKYSNGLWPNHRKKERKKEEYDEPLHLFIPRFSLHMMTTNSWYELFTSFSPVHPDDVRLSTWWAKPFIWYYSDKELVILAISLEEYYNLEKIEIKALHLIRKVLHGWHRRWGIHSVKGTTSNHSLEEFGLWWYHIMSSCIHNILDLCIIFIYLYIYLIAFFFLENYN